MDSEPKASQFESLRRLGVHVRKHKLIRLADGRCMRIRRGQLVEIPKEWVGKTVSGQRIRKRPSKKPHKLRRFDRSYGYRAWDALRRMDFERLADLCRRLGTDERGDPQVALHGVGHPRTFSDRHRKAHLRERGDWIDEHGDEYPYDDWDDDDALDEPIAPIAPLTFRLKL